MLEQVKQYMHELDARAAARMNLLSLRVDSIDRKTSFCVGVLSHMTEWTDKYESEVVRLAKELSDVKTRLAKLENKPEAA